MLRRVLGSATTSSMSLPNLYMFGRMDWRLSLNASGERAKPMSGASATDSSALSALRRAGTTSRTLPTMP